MNLDYLMILGGLFVGFVVGLTGMGGGALMTPMLVFFFGVPPLAAVSSDLVTSAIMKPVGSLVHIRHGSVHWRLVGWLMAGAVPSAFAGVFVLKLLGTGDGVQNAVRISLGVALLVAATALVYRAYTAMVQRARESAGPDDADRPIPVRPLPTLLVGVAGGLIVGMTSVGSGSIIIIALMALYPRLSGRALVGTDLVQAVPLVGAAALGHVLFGEFQLAVTLSLLIGSVPGVWLGARASASAPTGLIRRALSLVLLASGLKLLGTPVPATVAVLALVVVAGPPLWALVRRRHGLAPRTLRQDLLPWLFDRADRPAAGSAHRTPA